MIWTEELKGQVRVRASLGMSSSEIAKDMGLSKNQIMDVARRNKIVLLNLPKKRTRKRIVAPPQVLPGSGITVWELTRTTCRWPMWPNDTPPENKRYCGNRAVSGPYCPYHQAMSLK